MRKRVCIVVASEMTARTFLRATGMLPEPKNVDQITLDQLFRDPTLREKRGSAVRRRAINESSDKGMVRALVAFDDRVLGEDHPDAHPTPSQSPPRGTGR